MLDSSEYDVLLALRELDCGEWLTWKNCTLDAASKGRQRSGCNLRKVFLRNVAFKTGKG